LYNNLYKKMGGMAMRCLKCGREQENEQVFCDACLLEMGKYPVAPNATVHLPIRRTTPAPRKAPTRRRTVSPEEQLRILEKRLRFLTGILLVTLALLVAMIYPTGNYFIRNYHLRPGQNYNTIVTTTAPTETTDPFEGLAE